MQKRYIGSGMCVTLLPRWLAWPYFNFPYCFKMRFVGGDKNRTKSNKKRVGGIEPPSLAWKAKVLPLNYTRIRLNIQHNSG